MENPENLVYTADGQKTYGKRPSAEELQKLKASTEQADFENAKKALPKKPTNEIASSEFYNYGEDTIAAAEETARKLAEVREKISDLPKKETSEEPEEMREAA